VSSGGTGREAREAPASCASTVEGTWSEAGGRASRKARPELGGGPRSAEKMPGTTHSRWSSDDDAGAGAASDGGDRKGRARSSPPGLGSKLRAREGSGRARQGRSPRAEELHRCDAGCRETGGSRAGAGRPEWEGWRPAAASVTEPPQRLTCPGRAGNTARPYREVAGTKHGRDGARAVLRGSMTRQKLSSQLAGARPRKGRGSS
jgi:hypothetical protein